MQKLVLIFLFCSLICAAIANALPYPIEVCSHNGDTAKVIKGPDGKVLPDDAPIFVIRSHYLKHEIPKPGAGVSENEFVIQKEKINPTKNMAGELSFLITAADYDEFLQPAQAIKGEKVYFRVFDTTDTTFPSGTLYADTEFYEISTTFGSIQNVHFGEWKKIH